MKSMDDTNSSRFAALSGDRRKWPRDMQRKHRPPRRKRPGVVEKNTRRQKQPLGVSARCGTSLPPAARPGSADDSVAKSSTDLSI